MKIKKTKNIKILRWLNKIWTRINKTLLELFISHNKFEVKHEFLKKSEVALLF